MAHRCVYDQPVNILTVDTLNQEWSEWNMSYIVLWSTFVSITCLLEVKMTTVYCIRSAMGVGMPTTFTAY